MRTNVFMMVGMRKGRSVAAFGLRAVPTREQNQRGENESDGDHGVRGLFDIERGDLSVPQPHLVIERHRAAGKVAGHRDRQAGLVLPHGCPY